LEHSQKNKIKKDRKEYGIAFLRRQKVILLPLLKKDINKRYLSWLNDKKVTRYMEDVKWWINLKEGRNIEYIPKYKRGVVVRTIGELFFDLVSV